MENLLTGEAFFSPGPQQQIVCVRVYDKGFWAKPVIYHVLCTKQGNYVIMFYSQGLRETMMITQGWITQYFCLFYLSVLAPTLQSKNSML